MKIKIRINHYRIAWPLYKILDFFWFETFRKLGGKGTGTVFDLVSGKDYYGKEVDEYYLIQLKYYK